MPTKIPRSMGQLGVERELPAAGDLAKLGPAKPQRRSLAITAVQGSNVV
jgi:hypothetical protein